MLRPVCSPGNSAQSADQIVEQSVKANQRDWRAAPEYTFTESDTTEKGSHVIRKKYQVMMIEGSTYDRLIGVNGEPLSAVQAQREEEKLRREIAQRRNESQEARRNRIAKYAQERHQDHALMSEMAKAFQYKLLGNETLNGHKCYVIEATPKPGYAPPNRETKVLTGMRGKMWIDAAEFQWVKVHAEVFRPVAFGLFIARVHPGTEFTLENGPVGNGLWLPSHFSTTVKSTIMGVFSHNSSDDEVYSDYRPMSEVQVGGAALHR